MTLRRAVSVSSFFAFAVGMSASEIALRGYGARDAQAELHWEEQARTVPEPSRLRKNMEFLAGEPHVAGSPRSQAVAEWIEKQLASWGLDAKIERFEALMPYPTVRSVEVLGDKPYTAHLQEGVVPGDSSSRQAGQIPTFNAYGASGDVTAEVVYANFGVPDDYEWLSKQGIDVKGKIVLTRYGKSWRGIKPKVAAEHGAIGCLIYSDPHEDGYYDGDVFPKGPMRPSNGVQRGSVMDMTLYPGDPLSPGWASEAGSKRLTMPEAKTLMRIPVLPLSYEDAQPILEGEAGPLVPPAWRGSLPLAYHAGPGPVRVHIKTDYEWQTRPLWDVVATLPGTATSEEWVLAGNHHDAWVNGADDPVSGTSALLETARTLASLQQAGWRPVRTVKIAFWDGEEWGLLGSTEWVEKHAEELKQNAVAYLNSDNTGHGWLHAGGSHTLEQFAEDVASEVKQPGTNSSLADYAVHHPPPVSAAEAADAENNGDTPRHFALEALGAGSDYQGFLDYLGIASLNNGFSGLTKSGIYHSIYDSLYWYTHFSDINFVDGKALSQLESTMLMRLADAPVLPFQFGRFATTVSGYVDQIQKGADHGGGKLDLAPVRRQLQQLRTTSDNYEALLESVTAKDGLEREHLEKLNQTLIRSERVLTRPEGLPNRSWYKHQIYAPGFYTGYAVKTLPGLREAVEQKDWKLAQQENRVLEDCLRDLNAVATEAVRELSGF